MTAGSLRPEAKRALCRTAARRVQRNIRVEQEGHVVTPGIQVAIVNIRDVGQSIEILNLRPVGIVDHRSVLAVGDPQNFLQRLALRELDHGMIKFLATDKINRRAIFQGEVGKDGHMRADESDLDPGICVLNFACELDVSGKARSTGIQDQKLVVLGDLDGFFRRHVMGRGIEQARPLQHASGVGEPNRIPVGLNFTGCRPTRASPTIKVFKRRRIQEKRF